MAYIDVKYTVWGRFILPENTDLEALETTLNKGGYDPEYLRQIMIGAGDGIIDFELLEDTLEIIDVENNNEEPTIELWKDDKDDKPLWTNN